MKHFYLTALVMLLSAFFTCQAEVITEKPTGTSKFYERSGGLTYFNNGSTIILQNQSGFTEIVFSADGHQAWIKNCISGFFPEGSNDASWIVGEVTDNGTKIKVNLLQQVFYDENKGEYLLLAFLKKDTNSHETSYIIDKTAAQAVYTISGDKVSLDGTSSEYILGLVWSSDKAWTQFGDYETVYTEYEIPEAVTPPAGLTTKEYPISAVERMNETESVYNNYVNIGFDNNDVYIQGLDKFIPDAWIKGSLSGTAVTFPIQYIGTDTEERLHFLTSWKVGVGGVDNLQLNYYADLDAFECSAPVLINSNPKIIKYYTYYRSLYIGERPAIIELPEGVKTRNLIMTGKLDDTGIGYGRNFKRIVKVAEVDNKVYIQGLSVDLPESWAIGEKNGNELVIPSGTFMGFGENSSVYLHGGKLVDGKRAFSDAIRFQYDSENDKYTCDHIFFECSAREPRSYLWEYKAGVEIYFDPDAPSGADPDDLEQISSVFSGNVRYSKDAQFYASGKFSRNVTMAIDGYLVYIKGLSLECPDSWISGEMIDNTVTFECPQLQGSYNGADISVCGFDVLAWKNTDLTMKYDPDTKTYTFTKDLIVTKDPTTTYDYTVWIEKEATIVPDASGISGVIAGDTPADTTIYNLQGIPVKGKPSAGIYIVGGKKIYIK